MTTQPYTTPQRDSDETRLAILHIAQEVLLFHLFPKAVPGKAVILTPTILYGGKEVDWRTCKVMDATHDWHRNCIALKLHSLDFKATQPGQAIPYCESRIEERMVDILPEPRPLAFNERAATVATLRQLCADHGFSNSWQDGDNLADVIAMNVQVPLDEEVPAMIERPGELGPDECDNCGQLLPRKIAHTGVCDPCHLLLHPGADDDADIELAGDDAKERFLTAYLLEFPDMDVVDETLGRTHDTAAEAARAAAQHRYPDRPSIPFTAPGSRRIRIGACAEDKARTGKVNGSAMNVDGEWFEAETLLWIGGDDLNGILAVKPDGWNVVDGQRFEDGDGKPPYPNW